MNYRIISNLEIHFDFIADRPNNNNGDSFNSGPNNRNFGNRPFNLNNGGGGGGGGRDGNSFPNDRFEQNNQNSNGSFYEDFDLNEFARNLIGFERALNENRQDIGGNRNFNNRQQDSGNNGTNFFGNSSNWNFSNGGPNNQINSRGGANNRPNNNRNNFSSNDDTLSGQHCIHMRGLPYYSDEMDVFNVSSLF